MAAAPAPAKSRATTTEYLEKHSITEVLRDALNELMESRPVDIAGVIGMIMVRRAIPPVIDHLVGREVLDSRGNPTIEIDVYGKYLDEVAFLGRSSAPAGASIGASEIKEIRDSALPRYGGRGVGSVVKLVNDLLNPGLRGLSFADLGALDRKICEIDGTELKERLGSTLACAASFALAESAAQLFGVQLFEYLAEQFYGKDSVPERFALPTPYFSVVNGGRIAGSDLRIQEILIIPRSDIPFPEQLRMGTEVYHTLGATLARYHGVSSKNVGDEGGFTPPLKSPDQILTVIEKAISVSGYQIGRDVRFAIDAAAITFYNPANKMYEIEPGVLKSADDLIEYWKSLVSRHPAIIALEDGLDERDYDNWAKLTAALSPAVAVIGDDLMATQVPLGQRAADSRLCTGATVKVGQIGTLSEAFAFARLFDPQSLVVSHRSGETAASLLADLAVAIGAHGIKAGAPARGEHVQKYTRLLQIYDYLRERDRLAR